MLEYCLEVEERWAFLEEACCERRRNWNVDLWEIGEDWVLFYGVHDDGGDVSCEVNLEIFRSSLASFGV